MNDATCPVWLITGCSTGIGRELARGILQRGWRAIVTARNAAQVADLAKPAGDRALALALDVTKPEQIRAVVKAALEKFGRIDVLVNNAGYGYQSTVEEGDEAEIRFPGSGCYAASKHAVEGWSDSLRAELEPLGIGVTCVEPGPFRTDWAGRSLRQMPHARLGEAVCAFVIASRDGLTLRELSCHLERAGIARQKFPERLELVDDMPRTAAGKIKKDVLRGVAARLVAEGGASPPMRDLRPVG